MKKTLNVISEEIAKLRLNAKLWGILLTLMVAACVGTISASLWTHRDGNYDKAIDLKCVEEALHKNKQIISVESVDAQEVHDGHTYKLRTFSYMTDGSLNSKQMRVAIIDGKRTSFYHEAVISNKLAWEDQKVALVKEKKIMAEIEQSVGTACKIPHIETIMQPAKYL